MKFIVLVKLLLTSPLLSSGEDIYDYYESWEAMADHKKGRSDSGAELGLKPMREEPLSNYEQEVQFYDFSERDEAAQKQTVQPQSDNGKETETEYHFDISEKAACYVRGQCQEYSVNWQHSTDAENCHKFCGKKPDCKWWTFEPHNELCVAYSNCTESGHPNSEACNNCVSGQRECPARECHIPHKCKGHFVESYRESHLEECILKCKEHQDCNYFTIEKADDHCVLYEDCDDTVDCETCASGAKYCSRGYHGTVNMEKSKRRQAYYYTPEVPKWDFCGNPKNAEACQIQLQQKCQYVQQCVQIAVVKNNGRTIKLEVVPWSTVRSVKSKIQERELISPEEQRLLLPSGELDMFCQSTCMQPELDDDRTITYYGIEHQSDNTLYLVPPQQKFTINVLQVDAESRFLYLVGELQVYRQDSILCVKCKISYIHHYASLDRFEQTLSKGGQTLEDNRLVADYPIIGDGSTIDLQLTYNSMTSWSTGGKQTTTQRPVTTTAKVMNHNCDDTHTHCATWAGTGECTKNPVWMLPNCPVACNNCNTTTTNMTARCEDTNMNCATWALPEWDFYGNPENAEAYQIQLEQKCQYIQQCVQITVVKNNGRTIKLEVVPWNTVRSVKTKIQERELISPEEQRLLLPSGELEMFCQSTCMQPELDDDRTLTYYGIEHQSDNTLYLVPPQQKFTINVLQVHAESESRFLYLVGELQVYRQDSILCVKCKISYIHHYGKKSYELYEQTLSKGGQTLEDNRLVADYPIIGDGSTIDLQLTYNSITSQ